MIINLNKNIAEWLNSIRGEKSPAAMIVYILKQQMQDTYLTKDKQNDNNIRNGVTESLSQVERL